MDEHALHNRPKCKAILLLIILQGYVKVSIQVLSPHDEPITPPEETSKEAVDIES